MARAPPGGSKAMSDYQAILQRLYASRLLFGDPEQRGIVGAELATDAEIELFRRLNGALVRERLPLRLFVLVETPQLLKGLRAPHELKPLGGGLALRYLAEFRSLRALEAARRHLRQVTGHPSGAVEAPYLALSDPVEQHLILGGATFFTGLEFDDLRRMQIDIETCITPGFEFPSAAREGDRVAAIALADNAGFERVLSGRQMDERAMLEELARVVAERDPDVIEGHNLFRFDLEYLEARARRHRVRLALGRDGSELRSHASRLQVAERTLAYRRYDIYGRSIIDTWILAQHYDVASRELESFGLKQLAAHFGLSDPNRVRIDPSQVNRYFEHEPDKLLGYALGDVRETGALAALLAPTYFVQAQIFPYSYQNVVLRGNATKIDGLMLRGYLAQDHSVPLPNAGREVGGGLTELRLAGVARGVLHCDVTSLYPSLMLACGYRPANDALGIFLRLLKDLTRFRVEAKGAARRLAGRQRRHMEALQQAFKVLINSFYGYLGFALGHFNDFEAANAVTARGRELIRQVVDELERAGARVIEVDTDGIYFVPPFAWTDNEAVQRLLERVSAPMPAGVKLEVDGRYPAMLSYKMKNYVLLEESGELVVRGSGLRSRGLERYLRNFLTAFFRLLLEGNADRAAPFYAEYRDRLRAHGFSIAELAKTETLQDSPAVYRDKVAGRRRNVAAAYEIALASGRPYQSGDQISYYVTGRGAKLKVSAFAKPASKYDPSQPDENLDYYEAKLAELYAKFRPYAEHPDLAPAETFEAVPEKGVSLSLDFDHG